jgi:hypothetical protein
VGVALILGTARSERIRYDNYHVYQVIPETSGQIQLLTQLEGTSDSLLYLQAVTRPGTALHIVVAPHKEPDFLQILNENQIKHNLVEENLQRKLDVEISSELKRAGGEYDWTSYHTLEETYEWLNSLAKKYPGIVTVIKGGKSHEGRDILGVKISHNKDRKAIFIEGGIHAREWISPATVTYIANELLTSTDSSIRDLAESLDWYIFPNVNPDGFVYTHTNDRLWRKTRSRIGLCYGADPNRNWDFHFMEVGASSNPCSDTFAGGKGFSEIETKTLSEYINSISGNLVAYISFHSFSQLLLFPYGHTKEHAENHNDLQSIGDAAAKALALRFGTKYTVGNIYDAIYPAAGGSIDWVKGVANVKLTYTYELRPASGSWDGFILPANQIIPTCQETMDSLVALVTEAKKLNYY